MTLERLTWAGVDVSSWALRVRDLSGLLSVPGRRGEDIPVAGRDGAVRQPRKPHSTREFVLEFLVRGADPDGRVPAGGAARQFYANMDLLSQLVVQDVAPLVHTLPDGTERRLAVEVLNAVDATRYKQGTLAEVKVAFTAASPWWRALTPTVASFTLASGQTRRLVEFAPSTGRIDDALITFAAAGNNPRLTQVETGLGFGYDDAFSGARSVRLGDYTWQVGGGLTFDRARLFTDPRIGPWWVLDPVPGSAPTLRLDLTGGGPMLITVEARQSWAVG